MSTPGSLLCIHRDPTQLKVLQEKGFSLITATHWSQGLRLLVSKPVDAVVLEYHLGLLDGAAVAHEIKKVRPRLPIVMLAGSLELPEGSLKSVDAVVTSADAPRFLVEAIHTVLQPKDHLHFDAASAEAATPLEKAMPTPASRHILVVDDDPGVRDSVTMTLRAAGYDVVAAEDGFRALSQLRKKLPDVMVCDLNMPRMSGYELLSVVRRRFPQMTTVAMSGDYQGPAVPPGVIADSFFAKGQSPSGLLAIIAVLIRTSETLRSAHQKNLAPAWIPRNGNDSHGVPSVMLTCAECLRAFSMNLIEETTGGRLEIPCLSCHSINNYIIQPCKSPCLETSP